MTLLKKILSLAVGASLLVSPIALAQEAAPNDFGVPRLAHETSAELITLGCDEVVMTDEQALLAAYGMGWQIVLAVDAPEQSIMLCSPEVINSLQPLRAGQVQQATDRSVGDLLARSAGFIGDTIFYLLSNAIGWLFTLGGQIAGYVFDYTVKLLTPLFLVSQYRTNSTVKLVWPISLGIANAGFMLALVFIALTVVLQLDAGGGARRALPRLLLAAMLVNFSLLIGTVVIDFARLLTRLVAVVFYVPDLSIDLITLLEGAANIGPIYEELKNVGPTWSESTNAVRAFIGMLIVWSMAGSGLVLLFNMAMRYVMLIGLLIVSPFAYLFVAMPNTTKLANLWWSTFLKYVFYGPVALLVLLLAVWLGRVDLPGITDKLTEGLVSTMFLTIGFIAAARAGKYAGIAGSAAMISLVQKTGQRGRNLMYRGARATTRGAATVTGARAATRYAGGQLGTFGRAMGGNVLSRIPGLRNLGGGTGRRLADRLVGRGRSTDDAVAATNVRAELGRGTPGSRGKVANAAFAPQNLRRRSVGEEMMRAPGGVDDNVRPVFEQGSLNQIRNFAKNPELGKLSGGQRIEIVADLLLNPHITHATTGLSPVEQGKFIDEITRALEESNKKFTGNA